MQQNYSAMDSITTCGRRNKAEI